MPAVLNLAKDLSEWEKCAGDALGVDDMAIGIITFIVGFFLTFFGRRLLKILIFSMGAIFGFSVGWVTVPSLIQHFIALTPLTMSQVQYISAFGLALIGGLLGFYFWKVAVFASGGLAGMVVGGWTLTLAEPGMLEEYISRQGFLVCFVVLGGLVSLLLEAYIVIGTSIVIGAFCMIYGVDKFLRIGFADHLQHMIDYEKISLDRLSMNGWCLVGAGLVLAVFGMFYQCQTFKNKK